MKKLIVIVLAIILAFILYLVLRPDGSLTEVTINGQVLDVEIADEEEEQRLGLMDRESLDEDRGMLFVYETEVNPVFWMKNMLIPLDMIFITPEKTIGHIERNVPSCTAENDQDCPTYTTTAPTQYILEVNAGYADRHGLKIGDQVQFNDQSSNSQ